MKTFEIISYQDLSDNLQEEFNVDLSGCNERVIDFLAGLTFKEGSVKKLSNNEFNINMEGVN